MSCRERSGDDRFIAEGQCVRIGLEDRRFSRDSTGHKTDYRLDSGGISLGVQKAVGEAWHVGLGLAYESWDADADESLWRSDADQYQAGLVAKRQIGSTLVAASLSGGYADVDVVRNAAPGLQPKGNQDVWFGGGQLRVAHAIRRGNWYVKPRSDLSLVYVDAGSVDERGGGAAALDIEGDSELYAALQPAIEIGGEIDASDGYLLRPRLAVGVTHFLDDPSPEVDARFVAAGAPGFTVDSHVEQTTLDLELGLDVLSAGGINLGLGVFSQLAEAQSHLGGAARLAIPF
jgi:outer membrane autotransporter protein